MPYLFDNTRYQKQKSKMPLLNDPRYQDLRRKSPYRQRGWVFSPKELPWSNPERQEWSRCQHAEIASTFTYPFEALSVWLYADKLVSRYETAMLFASIRYFLQQAPEERREDEATSLAIVPYRRR